MKRLFILGIAMSILAIGCKKETLEETKPTQVPSLPTPTVINGRAYFATEQEFGNYMHQIFNSDIIQIETNNENAGLISFYELVNQTRETNLEQSDLNNDVTLIIEDPYLSHVLNYNLEIQIGSRIYRIEKDYSFSYEKGYFQQVIDFNSRPITLPDNQLTEINEFLSVAKHYILESAERVWIFGYGWRTNPKWVSYGHEKVMKDSQWETHLFFYKGVGVKVQYQEKRGWWIFKTWQNIHAEYLELSWDGTMKLTFSGTHNVVHVPVNGHKNGSHIKVLNEVLFMEAGGGISVSPPSGNITGTITGVDFDQLNTTHRCTKFGITQTENLNWIW